MPQYVEKWKGTRESWGNMARLEIGDRLIVLRGSKRSLWRVIRRTEAGVTIAMIADAANLHGDLPIIEFVNGGWHIVEATA